MIVTKSSYILSITYYTYFELRFLGNNIFLSFMINYLIEINKIL